MPAFAIQGEFAMVQYFIPANKGAGQATRGRLTSSRCPNFSSINEKPM